MMKEDSAYDNLPAKQSRWEHVISQRPDFLGRDNPPAI